MKKVISFLLSALMLFMLAACKQNKIEENDPNVFKIMTSFYPVYVVTSNIIEGAENVTLVNFTDSYHGCMHDFAMSNEDMTRLHGTDLFIASGMEMEPFVGASHLGIPGLELLDSGEDIDNTIEINGSDNSHYWMNFENALDQCDKIKRNLARINPENASIYEKNAEEYKAEITALKEDAFKRAEQFKGKEIVVYHSSFDYFAGQFGINVIRLAEGKKGTADEKTPEEIISYMKTNGIKALFTEAAYAEHPDVKKVAQEADAKVVIVDAVTKGDLADAKDAFLNAIKHNLSVLEAELK